MYITLILPSTGLTTHPTPLMISQVLFMVTGGQKADVIREILTSGEDGRLQVQASSYPAGMVQPTQGQLTWVLDQDAAGGLPGDVRRMNTSG